MKCLALLLPLLVAACSTSRLPHAVSPAATDEPFSVVVYGHPTARAAEGLPWSMVKIESPQGDSFSLPQARNLIRVGQRFEIWRGEQLLGMATVTSAKQENAWGRAKGLELQVGDIALSRLWRPDRNLRVALHGTFKTEDGQITREQMVAALKAYGCEVWDKAMPGVDLVIIGSNLLGDEWYRRARGALRFRTVHDDEAVRYLAPAK